MNWIEVGREVFAMRYAPLDQTIGAIRTDDGLVVIDSRAHRRHADELLDDLRSLDARSPAILVNTHYHWDHTFGNERFSAAMIVGHRSTRRALVERGDAMKTELVGADWLSEEAAGLIAEVEPTPPTVTFCDEMTLHPGDRTIELRYLGRGHTDSDIVVTVDGVVFAGDLVEVGAPPSFGDSFPAEWVATLDALVPLCDGAVVPGHGDPTDRAFVVGQRNEIAAAVAGEPVFPAAVMDSIRERISEATE